MTTPIYLAAPKPHLCQPTTIAQRLHDMVVGEALNPAIPTAPWSLNATLSVPFDIWQPLPARHNFHMKYSPAVSYGYNRVHTASLFSPQDEILGSSRERFVTQPIGSRIPKPSIVPPTSNDSHHSNIAHPTPQLQDRKANPLPIFLNKKILRKLRSRRGSQRLRMGHNRHHSSRSIIPRAQILGQ